MSYTAPKPYEAPAVGSPSQYRAMSKDNFRPPPSHHPNLPADLPHSHSAPVVPTTHTYEPSRPQDLYQDPSYQVEPLRLSRNSRSNDQMNDPYNPYAPNGRRTSAMQPTVEDEDDMPPPPPVHRSSASTIPQPREQPPDYHNDTPAPLNSGRYREQSPQYGYEASPPYGADDYGLPHPQERRYTVPHPNSRPVSRDTMAPSPLRNETIALPAALVAGVDATRKKRDSVTFQTPLPVYDSPSRVRQLSEPDYRTPPQYDSPTQPHPLRLQQSVPPSNALQYYNHPPPEEPRRRSPVEDAAPIIKPRAVSPAVSPVGERGSRMPARSMPTRKSVSPRPPPPDESENPRRLSGVPFDPDSFDVFNPSAKPNTNTDPDRPGSSMEMNDKGQIVTFNGRVIDASDHLPIDSWAPEPERKNEKERPARTRPVLSGARDLEDAKQREERYQRDRAERDRIRTAANSTFGSPSTALVTARHDFSRSSPVNAGAMVLVDRDATPPSTGRNRLQKRNQRPTSSYELTTHSSPAIPIPNANPNVLRERQNLGGYGSSPGYGRDARHSIAAPPIPAKIPLGRGEEDMMALSLELQSIDIGPGGGRRTNRGTARRYGY
ncbi:hypothetical protein P280DRAFT_61684 [Massarina eburnea CBS 473.64]|uniref:Uncharacterized protein n=1 Tax=Massarina eburnea CBS 473.64 TaxID=1395130 RepID=A0A6A6RFR6_9PLEO|nr:hypothetical protein P280DRAFT_61684 [Massarina eburnea CBS 473.64]